MRFPNPLKLKADPAAVAAALESLDPVSLLRNLRIELCVRSESARLFHANPAAPAPRVLGAWDPLLRRIELFEASALDDSQLAGALAHELFHALATAPHNRDESLAAQFAIAVVSTVSPDRIAGLARALRTAQRS
ncbi:MAG: hypothetical protein IPM64_11725 [Phycisphaerales bacterium]|nr:hypothetical protein [Phycisphaerales bacterium]